MIRPTTVLCLLAACGSGLYMYSEKHRTELLDRDIGHLIHATEAERARTGLLRAEWALLNEPGRLQDMAGRYLTLHPMAPTQFVQVAELSAHLPAPATEPQAGSTDDDDVPAAAPGPVVASAEPAEPGQASASVPASAASPVMTHPMMSARTDTKTGPKQLVAGLGARAHAPHRVTLAERDDAPLHDGMMAHGAPLPLAAPQPIGARVYSAMAHPMRSTQPRPAIVSAVPAYAPAQAFVPSALGGGAALPPPVPYGR